MSAGRIGHAALIGPAKIGAGKLPLRFRSSEPAVGVPHIQVRKRRSRQENAAQCSVGSHHKAVIAEVGANVRSWVYTGHSQVAKRKSTVFGVNGGF